MKHLRLVAEIEEPGLGPVEIFGVPFKPSGPETAIRRPAPRLGEHTADVLEELGLPTAEIERLAAARVVQLAP